MEGRAREAEASCWSSLVNTLAQRPWLLPFIYTIYSLGGSTKLNELRGVLGVRSAIVKRAIWWLTKFNIVTRSKEKIVMNQCFYRAANKLFLNLCRTRSYYIARLGATYLVVSVKQTRVTAYTVPAQLIEELSTMSSNVGAEFTPKELSDALSIPPKLAYRVVKVRSLLRECWDKGGQHRRAST